MANKFYTDIVNAQVLLALLKAHGLKRVIANPGTTNMALVGSVQNDPWFEVYSGVDERHSAYMACGMAAETNEPVVLCCTGATASRNYLPAMTEAYYRKLPILVVTFSEPEYCLGNNIPQMVDRFVAPRDTYRLQVSCPGGDNVRACELQINRAILELTRHGGGPVHLNLELGYGDQFLTQTLPQVLTIRRHMAWSAAWPAIDPAAKVLVALSSRKALDERTWSAVERFANAYDAVVFTEGSATYTGARAIKPSYLCFQNIATNPKYAALKPDLIIQIGDVSGCYSSYGYLRACGAPVWRVAADGELRDPFQRLTEVFEMPEDVFFTRMDLDQKGTGAYFAAWQAADEALRAQMPEIPFANPWIAAQVAGKVPKGSVVHLGILNSLRGWNYQPVCPGVETFSNVGGFGIDGCMSTLLGSSLVAPEKLYVAILGDLAFFYDMNGLGNRHLGKNIRILVVNNGCGGEFTLYSHPAYQFGDDAKRFIAAGGHFGNQVGSPIKPYVESLGFTYLRAEDKTTFAANLAAFLSEEADRPVVFECFTDTKDESAAVYALNHVDAYTPPADALKSVKGLAKRVVHKILG